ncbi:hypothetical protein MVEN_01558200 [Mycena venus]|uniref:Uncharacterized protein n=1 Tax=Mycena venus TaxID=2733690 RepID=A0A8H7CRC4_9AGAR|nr:hypothetical protein MVEN_01558200 [Mycena venus]
MSLSYAALGRPAPSINASCFRCPCQSCGYKVLQLRYSRNRREYYLKHWSHSHLVFWHHFGPGVVPQDRRRWLHLPPAPPAAPVLPAAPSTHPPPPPANQVPAPVSQRQCALSHCQTTRIAAKCNQRMCLTHCAERGGCSIHTTTLQLSPPHPLRPGQLATLSGYRNWTTTTPQALESAELARSHALNEQEAWMASLFPLPPSSPPQPTSPHPPLESFTLTPPIIIAYCIPSHKFSAPVLPIVIVTATPSTSCTSLSPANASSTQPLHQTLLAHHRHQRQLGG